MSNRKINSNEVNQERSSVFARSDTQLRPPPEEPVAVNEGCLSNEELSQIRDDADKSPETLSSTRIDEIIRRFKESEEKGDCEIPIQLAELFKKFVFLLELERTNRNETSCFSPRQVNELIRAASVSTDKFTDAELFLLIRSIERNNAKSRRIVADSNVEDGNCSIGLDQQQLFNNLLQALRLERAKRLAEGVPKTVEQRTRLDTLSEEATLRRELADTRKKLPNLTVNEISIKVSETVLGVLEDLLTRPADKDILTHVIETFTKGDRLLFIGIILVVISVFMAVLRSR